MYTNFILVMKTKSLLFKLWMLKLTIYNVTENNYCFMALGELQA